VTDAECTHGVVGHRCKGLVTSPHVYSVKTGSLCVRCVHFCTLPFTLCVLCSLCALRSFAFALCTALTLRSLCVHFVCAAFALCAAKHQRCNV